MIGSVSAAAIVRGAGRRGATVGGTAVLLIGAAIVVALLALIPVVGYVEAVVIPVARRPAGAPQPREVRRAPLAREVSPQPLILVVIDGLTPSMLEGAIGSGETPNLAALAARGAYRRATSVFPSLTPVCLSSIATGAHGDIHEIPHLVWYDAHEQRLVEYGSSFGAVRAAGIGQTLRDTLVNMNGRHLGAGASTLFESLADAGLRTAAVNFTAYRGRTMHRSSLPFLGDVLGPERFFFYNLFSSDRTGAPLSWRNRPAGSIDAYATAVGRWLVTRDAFDFLVFYLSDYDYASHEHGPDTALEALQRCDDAIGSLAEAAGGIDGAARALRRRRDGRSRPDARARGGLARRDLRRSRGRAAARVEPGRARLPPAGLPARSAGGRCTPRRRCPPSR